MGGNKKLQEFMNDPENLERAMSYVVMGFKFIEKYNAFRNLPHDCYEAAKMKLDEVREFYTKTKQQVMKTKEQVMIVYRQLKNTEFEAAIQHIEDLEAKQKQEELDKIEKANNVAKAREKDLQKRKRERKFRNLMRG